MTKRAFFNLYNHGFIRTALCIPSVRVADPLFNAEQTIDLANRAAGEGAMLALFPELGMSAYSNDDLFHQEALLKGVLTALGHVVNASKRIPSTILVVGAPLCVGNRLFNCGIVINGGLIVGVAVKSYLPNYREFYESRQFSPAEEGLISAISLCNQENVPFGNDLIFPVTTLRNFSLYIEICEDLWVPIPPSSFAALAGATVIGNLSASNITVGKADYRHSLVSNQSARTISAYLYTAAGFGESTNDLAWDGHALIYENGTLKAESLRFSQEPQVIVADIDLDRLAQERMRMTSFGQNARHHRQALSRFRQINITAPIPKKKLLLAEGPARFPYVPADASLRNQRCCEIYNIQATSLAKRLLASQSDNAVIGVSGGLDSAQALIVAARTMDLLGRPRTGIKAYTMPGFATSDKTYRN
ncbi:MAG: NAD(+) synthase, partial [Deltaproteobacteria bacterium]|nr:NAD(+) synthase [Deltaproteobacteria bacterium]